MVMKAVKLDETAIKAALGHGSTVNLGILEMERLLKGYQKPINDATNEQKRAYSSAKCTPIRDLVSNFQPDTSFHPVDTSENPSDEELLSRKSIFHQKTPLEMAKEKFFKTEVPESGVPFMFTEAYWRKFREEVAKCLEPHIGS